MQIGTENSIDLLVQKVVGLAMKVHRRLGMGLLESVYVNALSLELSKANITFEREKRIPVFYEENVVGDFLADIVVDQILIVELKAVEALTTAHSVQVVNYLSATRLDTGLLLNFGARSLQFKTKTREYTGHAIRDNTPSVPLIPSLNPVNSV